MVTDQELETVPITEQHIDNNSEDEVLSQISQPLHFPSTLHIPHPSWRPHVPKPIQHTPYDADEVVWIKNKPVPANDVEEADGGSLTVGLQQTSKHQFGNPAPLGLCAFGLSCFLTSLFNGIAQIVAGVWCMILGNTFAFTSLTSYGCFWISFGFILNKNSGISASYTTDEFPIAMGHFLLVWTIFTTMIFFCTIRTTVPFFLLFFFVEIRYICLTTAYYKAVDGVPSELVLKIAGWAGILSGIFAWYNAFVGLSHSALFASPEDAFFPLRDIHLPWSLHKSKYVTKLTRVEKRKLGNSDESKPMISRRRRLKRRLPLFRNRSSGLSRASHVHHHADEASQIGSPAAGGGASVYCDCPGCRNSVLHSTHESPYPSQHNPTYHSHPYHTHHPHAAIEMIASAPSTATSGGILIPSNTSAHPSGHLSIGTVPRHQHYPAAGGHHHHHIHHLPQTRSHFETDATGSLHSAQPSVCPCGCGETPSARIAALQSATVFTAGGGADEAAANAAAEVSDQPRHHHNSNHRVAFVSSPSYHQSSLDNRHQQQQVLHHSSNPQDYDSPQHDHRSLTMDSNSMNTLDAPVQAGLDTDDEALRTGVLNGTYNARTDADRHTLALGRLRYNNTQNHNPLPLQQPLLFPSDDHHGHLDDLQPSHHIITMPTAVASGTDVKQSDIGPISSRLPSNHPSRRQFASQLLRKLHQQQQYQHPTQQTPGLGTTPETFTNKKHLVGLSAGSVSDTDVTEQPTTVTVGKQHQQQIHVQTNDQRQPTLKQQQQQLQQQQRRAAANSRLAGAKGVRSDDDAVSPRSSAIKGKQQIQSLDTSSQSSHLTANASPLA